MKKNSKKNLGTFITDHLEECILKPAGEEGVFLNHALYQGVEESVLEQFPEIQFKKCYGLSKEAQHHIREQGFFDYNVREKVKRVIKKEGYIYTPISTWAGFKNKKQQYDRALEKKSFKKGFKKGKTYHRLHQSHFGIWTKAEHQDVLEHVVKTRDKNGAPIIYLFGTKDDVVRNGSSKFFGMKLIYAFIEGFKNYYGACVRKKMRQLEGIGLIIKVLSNDLKVVRKLCKALSTDFIGCVQFVHRKISAYLNKIKMNRKNTDFRLLKECKNTDSGFLEQVITSEWLYE